MTNFETNIPCHNCAETTCRVTKEKLYKLIERVMPEVDAYAFIHQNFDFCIELWLEMHCKKRKREEPNA